MSSPINYAIPYERMTEAEREAWCHAKRMAFEAFARGDIETSDMWQSLARRIASI